MGAIQLLSGANAGKELELTKPLTTLGKPGVQVAVLTRRPQGYFITHVEGASRPAVNGQQIGAAPHALKDHDVIELAGREDGILPQGLSRQGRPDLKQHIVRIAIGLAITLFFIGHAAQAGTSVGFITQLDNIIYDARLRLTMPRGRRRARSSSSTSTRRAWARSAAGPGAAT